MRKPSSVNSIQRTANSGAAARIAAAMASLVIVLTGITPVAASATRCPAPDFPHFLAAFASSVPLQRMFTATTLQSETIDATAYPEPRSVIEMLSGPAIRFPVMPSAPGYQHTTVQAANGDMVVKRARPDTDDHQRFYFRKSGDCWELYRKADDSL